MIGVEKELIRLQKENERLREKLNRFTYWKAESGVLYMGDRSVYVGIDGTAQTIVRAHNMTLERKR